ncbi:MATE family efflux transporter [Sulfurovum sp. XGS-02]|uniref:MATE family efflux transporter n=1 Tax=Sulfurovum sp. XGS-02 TaxID=2925411 RepID=UPI002064CD90|nr:MATE family efflux transporter [Sulfurovum sp. XGS-02]UPT77699.1 MATE family efflux transporter [Sulfurovum sp. XGS-02]
MIRFFPKKHQKILKLALPAAVNSLLDMLQVITDLIMVGRLSAFAVAAVGLGLQSLMFLFAMLSLLHIGTSALLSRFVGAGQFRRASTGLSTLLQFALFLSLPVMGFWYFFASNVYVWFGTVHEVVRLGEEYVQTLTWMLPFVLAKLVFVTALNAAGDTKTPMQIKIASIALNVFLNYLLIFGNHGFPQLGVMGAAVGTVIVNILEMIVYMVLYLREKTPYIPAWHYSQSLLKRALKVGIPASFERSLTFGSFMLFTVIIAQFGTEVLAGYQIGLRVEGLAFMPGIGFTIAAMALMGQGLGAKKPEQSREDVILVLKYTVGFMFFLSFFMIFMPEKIVWLFTDDAQTIEEASLYLRIVGLSQIPLAYNFVLSGALRGAGDTKRTLKINLVSVWLVRIIPAFVLSWYFESILLVYIAMISDTFVKATWLWRTFDKGQWQKIKV